jgi:hypothetical protein
MPARFLLHEPSPSDGIPFAQNAVKSDFDALAADEG